MRPLLQPASFAVAADPLPAKSVRIRFIGHNTFQIETPGGIVALTDYNGVLHGDQVPDVVTMNIGHPNHYTNDIDPRIKYALRGWDPAGGVARNDVTVGDLRVFSVPTDLVNRFGDGGARNNNSMFVFRVANICIGHAGHLNRPLTKDEIAEIGHIDVLMLPIDGMATLRHDDAMTVIEQLHPAIVIPMHIIFRAAADRFAAVAEKTYPIRILGSRSFIVSRDMLPGRTEIVFLQEE